MVDIQWYISKKKESEFCKSINQAVSILQVELFTFAIILTYNREIQYIKQAFKFLSKTIKNIFKYIRFANVAGLPLGKGDSLRFPPRINRLLFKIGALKHFAIFTRKHLRWSLFLIKLQAWRLHLFYRTPLVAASVHKNPKLSLQQFLSLLSSVTWNWTLAAKFTKYQYFLHVSPCFTFTIIYFVLLSLKANPADLPIFPLMNPINLENNKEKNIGYLFSH